MAGGTWGGTILPVAVDLYDRELMSFWVSAALYLLLDQVGIIYLPWMDDEPRYDVRVLNMSFGDVKYNRFWGCCLYFLNQEVLLVAAAGNYGEEGNPVVYPAATELGLAHHHGGYTTPAPADLVLSVTANDRNGYRSVWDLGGGRIRSASYYDPENEEHLMDWVDVCAPGSDILVLNPVVWPDDEDYDIVGGTSLSAPITAALGALRMSRYPDETPKEVRTAIETYIKWWFVPRSEELPDLVDYYNVLIREP